jgi:hypothetical protein
MPLIDLILSAIQLQSADTPATPSLETLKAIADLVNAVAGHPPTSSWLSPQGLEAITRFIVALAWPLLVGFVIFRFSPQLISFLKGLHEVEIWGIKAKIETELTKSADQAAPSLSTGPSKEELRRAVKVEDLAKHDVALIRQQVDGLAFEYDNLRGSLPSGDKRTRLMEQVVSQMRTIGRAAYAIRYELMASPSPGHRLQAVACLQVLVDWELLEWLACRLREERRFIGYHALIALIAATNHPDARDHVKRLEAAAIESGQGLPEGSDRWNAWRRLMERVALLKGGTQ